MFELLSTAPDYINASGVSDAIVLAQKETTIGEGGGDFDGLNVRFAPNVEKLFRILGIALGIAWIAFAAWLIAVPGKSRQASQRMGGVIGMIAALVGIVALLNVNTAAKFIDSALIVGNTVINTVIDAFPKR